MAKLNAAGLNLIKSFEGLELTAYKDAVGVWTIGYGHTNAAGTPYVSAGMKITRQQAEDILRRDLVKYENGVKRNVRVPLNDYQYSALVSFVYNLGEGNFRSSTLLRKINAGDFVGASKEFAKWNKAGGKVLRGLTRRREAERKLFLFGSKVPASPVQPVLRTPDRVSPPTTIWGALVALFKNIFGGRNV